MNVELTLCYPLLFLLAVLGIACTDIQHDVTKYEYVLHWEVGSNFLEGNRFSAHLKFVNESGVELRDQWTLYFNFLRLIDPGTVSPPLRLTHINGDFYRIDPTEIFEGLPPGKEVHFSFEALGSAIKKMDAPAGAYIEFRDGTIAPVKVIVGGFVREEQLHRSPDDKVPVPTPEFVYEQNFALTKLSMGEFSKITPTPVSVVETDGYFTITGRTVITFEPGLENEARFLANALAPLLGTPLRISEVGGGVQAEAIHLTLGNPRVGGDTKQPGDEAYRLSITETGVEILGSDPAGVFYGIQSLRSLIPIEAWHTPTPSLEIGAIAVEDAPGFRYRGLHLDVARNFQSVETVKRLLDVMAFYKLNKFHFHLTDDEGWRLEIRAFPELTAVGGRRGHTHDEREHLIPSYGSGPYPDPAVSMGSGWYTQEEYIDILRYAKERHIEVIPEIDVPGHARAAIIAMKSRYDRLVAENRIDEADRYRIHDPEDRSEYMSIQRWKDNVINVCQESTYRFFEVVFDEIIEMHRKAGIPLSSIHIGGDEVPRGVWVKSPQCEALIARSPELDSVDDLQVWFFGRMKKMLEERGIVMSGWEEIAMVGYYGGTKELNREFAGSAIPYVWSNIWRRGTEEYAYRLANAGYEVVMSHASNFYFDLAYNKDPEEAGLYWADFVDTPDPFSFIPFDLYKSAIADNMGHLIPENFYAGYERLTPEGRSNILGLQGQLWGETFRHPHRVEYMALPRMISLAERAWVPHQEWMDIEDRSKRLEALGNVWNEFANRLGQRELPRLDRMNGGYHYRIPPPGAIIEDGQLKVNVSYPGMVVRYTTDGSTPEFGSHRYDTSIAIEEGAVIKLRTFDTRGRGSRVVVLEY